jgi:hypothetical protein
MDLEQQLEGNARGAQHLGDLRVDGGQPRLRALAARAGEGVAIREQLLDLAEARVDLAAVVASGPVAELGAEGRGDAARPAALVPAFEDLPGRGRDGNHRPPERQRLGLHGTGQVVGLLSAQDRD